MLEVHSMQFKSNTKQTSLSSRAADSHYSYEPNVNKQLSSRTNDHAYVANLGNEESFFNVVKFAIPERKHIKLKVNVVVPKSKKNYFGQKQKIPSQQTTKSKQHVKPLKNHVDTKQNEYQNELQNNHQVEQIQSQLKLAKPKKKYTLPTKLATDDTQSHTQSQSKVKIEKLNLGLKKKKEKGKMNDYFKSILLRTLVEDDDVVIKKSAFYSNQKLKTSKPASLQRPNNREKTQQVSTSKKVQSHNRINPPKDRLKGREPRQQKGSSTSIKLPDIHEHKKIVELVKQEESKKNKRLAREYSKSEMKYFDKQKGNIGKNQLMKKQDNSQRLAVNHNSCMKIEPETKNRAIYSEAIPEQIEYSSIYKQKQEKVNQNQQSIEQQITSSAIGQPL